MGLFSLSTDFEENYSKKMHDYQSSIYELEDRLSDDQALLCSYYDEEYDSRSLLADFRKEINETIKELEKTKEEMEEEIQNFALGVLSIPVSSDSGLKPEDIFNMMFEPFMAAIEPLGNVLDMIGLPDLPIIGNIKTIIEKVAKTGRVISKLDASLLEAARREEEERKKLEGEIDEIERKRRQAELGMTDWQVWKDNFKNSKLGRICVEIVEIFEEILKIIMMICQTAGYAAILMLIDKLKPVVEAFNLALDDVIGIFNSIKIVMQMLITSSSQMLKFFYRALEDKLSELWGVMQFIVHGGNLPVNFMISAIHADMVCCDFEIRDIKMQMDRLEAEHKIKDNEKSIESYKNMRDKYRGEKRKMQIAIPPAKSKDIRKKTQQIDAVDANIDKTEAAMAKNKSVLMSIDIDIDVNKEFETEMYNLELDRRILEDQYLEKHHDDNLNLLIRKTDLCIDYVDFQNRIFTQYGKLRDAEIEILPREDSLLKKYEGLKSGTGEIEGRLGSDQPPLTDEEKKNLREKYSKSFSELEHVCAELGYVVNPGNEGEENAFLDRRGFWPRNSAKCEELRKTYENLTKDAK